LPEQRFSPWRDYIDALPLWDGIARLETAIPPENVTPTPYTRQAFVNFFLALQQRVHEPGCQVDSMLVLAGGQGLRKTSFFRAIAPRSWMCAEPASIPDTNDKDLLEEAHLAAVVLFDEIDKLRRRDEQAALKAFVTRRHDTWRPSTVAIVHPTLAPSSAARRRMWMSSRWTSLATAATGPSSSSLRSLWST